MAMSRPVPLPDVVTAGYWEGAAAGELRIQMCSSCGRRQHPPEVACGRCHGRDLGWSTMSGRARLYSFTVVQQAFDPRFVGAVPYVLGIAELEDDPSVRVLTNVVDAQPDALEVGMALEVVFERVGDQVLPQFRPC